MPDMPPLAEALVDAGVPADAILETTGGTVVVTAPDGATFTIGHGTDAESGAWWSGTRTDPAGTLLGNSWDPLDHPRAWPGSWATQAAAVAAVADWFPREHPVSREPVNGWDPADVIARNAEQAAHYAQINREQFARPPGTD